MFDFDYVLECYMFVFKCCYGYFVLFILYCGVLVGWLDVKVYCV